MQSQEGSISGSQRASQLQTKQDVGGLPLLTQGTNQQQHHRRKSSLRSLQEIQSRRSQHNGSRQAQNEQLQQIMSGIDGGGMIGGGTNALNQQYPNLLNMSYEPIDPRQMIDRLKVGKTYLEGSMSMFHTKQLGQSEIDQIGEDLQDEKSHIMHSGLRKRSPSDIIKRKSQPVTPRRLQQTVVPQGLDPLNFPTSAGLRQSFKLQSLAPIDNGALPGLAQTQRFHPSGQNSGGQIGPLFSNQPSQNALARPSIQGSGSQTGRDPSRQKLRSASILQSQKPVKQWGSKASTFQFKNAPPKEVSEFLQQVIQEPVGLMFIKPNDIDSTEALDSFLDSLYIMVEEKILDFNEDFQSKLHLAAGIRQEVCEDFLSYFAQLQTRNKLLINAVEFFNEYLTKISELEGDKMEREKQVNSLVAEKEELFLSKYDLERKLAEMSTALKQAQTKEKEAVVHVKNLQKRFDSKVAECESLMFRIKHIEDMDGMLEPPNVHNQSVRIGLIEQLSPGEQMDKHDTIESLGEAQQRNMKHSSTPAHSLSQQTEHLRNLESTNKRLETELSVMKEALQKLQETQFKDNVDHFVRIQELFNKVQIENKQLRTTNKKLESKLEAKERLVSHLESKVTQVMMDKEDIIVKLKSDIVLLKSQIEAHDLKFKDRLASENLKFQKDYQANFSAQEKRLKDEKDQVLMEKSELTNKSNQLSKELEQMAFDFNKYRADITKKDQEKEQSITELQNKLKQSGQLNETQTKQLQDRIETLNNQNLVQAKQNSILELKLRLIKDSVETLYKQKMFIVENIERSSRNLARESAQVEQTMMNQNDNQEYLISVKKAVKMSQTMVEMGLQAINQVSQIVAFLKIDEVKNMISAQDNESLAKAQEALGSSQSDNQQHDIEKLNMLFQQEDLQDGSQVDYKPIQKVYDHNLGSFKINQKLLQGASLQQVSVPSGKSESEYYSKNLLELISVTLKVFGEVFISTGTIDEQIQLPNEFIKLASYNHRKSDVSIEQEIYSGYLANTKRMLEDRYSNLMDENRALKYQIEKLQFNNNIRQTISNDENRSVARSPSGLKSRLKNLSKESSHGTGTNPATGTIGEGQLQEVSNTVQLLPRRGNSAVIRDGSSMGIKKDSSVPHLNNGSIETESAKQRQRMSSLGSRQASAIKRSPAPGVRITGDAATQIAAYESQNEALRIQMEELKFKHKDLSMGLANKIVLLEEQIEEKRLRSEQELAELEQLQRDEIEKTKQGIQQREALLKQRAEEYKSRADQAEEQIRNIREQVSFLNSEIQRITTFYRESDNRISLKEQEIVLFKENVSSYVNLKVSQRNLFSITIEINEKNQTMINEAMLKYYLYQCLKLDKDKFRFVSTEELQIQWQLKGFEDRSVIQEAQSAINQRRAPLNNNYIGQNLEVSKIVETPNEEVTVVKILIEIVDDQENVDKYMKLLKTQIRQGTSILYDLQPLYLSLNLGQCGLQSTANSEAQLKNYHLIKRKGVMIRHADYVVSVLRHRDNPLTFMIIATSTDLVEEFILELQARDLFEITEGELWKLETSEPLELVDSMIENLTISVKQPGNIRSLQCEHKIFFNQLFVEQHVNNKNQNGLEEIEAALLLTQKASLFPEKDVDSQITHSQDSLAFRNTTFRHKQIIEKVTSTRQNIREDFKSIINQEAQCQTDTESQSYTNLLAPGIFNNDLFTTTYQGYQRLGKSLELKIKIDEGQKSGTQILTFEEIRTKQRCQVCIQDSSKSSISNSRYVIHSECLKFFDADEEPHMLLVTFEKFQEDGFLIKLHDLKAPASEEFFIVKKSNNQYARMTRAAGIETLIANGKEHEELRNLLFDLTFTLSVPSQQILYANLAVMEQQLSSVVDPEIMGNQIDSLKLVTEMVQMPEIKRGGKQNIVKESERVQNLKMVMLPAFARVQADQYSLPSGVLLQKHERGELLYRNIYTVRCCFNGNMEQEHDSLISFYEKKNDGGQIAVEVFLFRENQKMSIASQVSSQELFGNTYHNLSFHQKTEMLDQMMEKLYVLSDGSQFHLKVENDALGMSKLKQQRRDADLIQQDVKNNQNSHNSLQQQSPRGNLGTQETPGSTDSPAPRAQSVLGPLHFSRLEQKKQEIEEQPSKFLSDEKAIHVKTYAQIDDRILDYNAYFIQKVELIKQEIQTNVSMNQGSPNKKHKATVKKNFIERQNIASNNLEDSIDFEYVYINASQKDGKNYSSLLSVKMLVQILTCNPLESQQNHQMILSKDKERLAEYLKMHTKIDFKTGALKIESSQPSQEYIKQLFANEIGGTYLRRDENSFKFELEEGLIEKKLLMNQEVDLSEFSYDVKLYQIFSKELNVEKRALSYSFEVFCLNEPDLIYRYNHALHEQSSFLHSPVHIGYDMVNLIENPLSKVRQNEESKRKAEFQELFSKYIDNRFILMVNEQIFPHQINFCIYEPSSRLHWSHTFDPQLFQDEEYQETISKSLVSGGRWNIEIGQLSILDAGTAERFISLVMADALDQCAPAEVCSTEIREDNWAEIGDQETLRYEILKGKQIAEDLCIHLSKMSMDCLNIEIYNPKQDQENDKTQNSLASLLFKGKQASQQSQAEKPKAPSQRVRFAINATQRNKFISKLIRVKDHEISRVLQLSCDLRDPQEIIIKVIELISSTVLQTEDALKKLKPKILFLYRFKEKKINPIYGKGIALNVQRRHLQEAIAEVVTSGLNGSMSAQVVDRAGTLYEAISRKQPKKEELSIFTQGISLTQRRLIATAGVQSGIKGEKQSLILHRKTFYDEPHEKLIIVSVSIECTLNRRKGHGAAQMCLQDIDTFKLNINEPETQREVDFDLFIQNCFLEEEISGGINLKNVNHLKKMAKVLVEERAIIKRVNILGANNNRDADELLQNNNNNNAIESTKNNNLYTVEINLSQITSPMTLGAVGGIDSDNTNNQTIGADQKQQKDSTSQSSGGDLAEIHSLMKPRQQTDSKGKPIEDSSAKKGQSETSNGTTINGVPRSQSPTNGSQGSSNGQIAGSSNQIAKSQSQPRDILPPQQSVIEEEGSQEDYEDSPNLGGRSPESKKAGIDIDLYRDMEDDEDDMERVEEQPVAEENEDDEEISGDDDLIVDEDEAQSELGSQQQPELLFETNTSQNKVLQILRSSNPLYVYQVRHITIDSELVNKDQGVITELSNQSVETIAKKAKISLQALDEEQPELFDVLADYVMQKFLGKVSK